MLPANVGTVNPRREVPKTTSPVKSFSNKATATVKQPEEMRFVPIAPKPAKPCNITINNYSNSTNNYNNNSSNTCKFNSKISKKINNNTSSAIKPKLTPINVVPKPFKTNFNQNHNNLTAPVPPLIQLVSNGPNGNASSLLSILTPKTLLNPTCTKTNVQTVVPTQANPQLQLQLQSQPQPQPQPQVQPEAQAPPMLIRSATTPATISTQQQQPQQIPQQKQQPQQHQQEKQQQQLQKNADIHNSSLQSSGTAAVSTQTQLINMVAAKGSIKTGKFHFSTYII